MTETKWQIKFKVVDKKARRKHKKSVLSNINVVVPTNFIGYIFSGIMNEVKRIDNLSKP